MCDCWSSVLCGLKAAGMPYLPNSLLTFSDRPWTKGGVTKFLGVRSVSRTCQECPGGICIKQETSPTLNKDGTVRFLDSFDSLLVTSTAPSLANIDRRGSASSNSRTSASIRWDRTMVSPKIMEKTHECCWNVLIFSSLCTRAGINSALFHDCRQACFIVDSGKKRKRKKSWCSIDWNSLGFPYKEMWM